jgi:hypothetical protein
MSTGTTIERLYAAIAQRLGDLTSVTTVIEQNVTNINTYVTDLNGDAVKSIVADSTKLTIGGTAADVGIDVNEANIVHDNLSGAGTHTHSDIDAHIDGSDDNLKHPAADITTVAGTNNYATVENVQGDLDALDGQVKVNTDAIADVVSDLATHISTTQPVATGGTGLTTYTAGDMLVASGATALSKLAVGASGTVLLGGTAPTYGKADLTSHVSGVLPVANGGTGSSNTYTSGQLLIGKADGTLAKATLTSDSEYLIITNGDGAITFSPIARNLLKYTNIQGYSTTSLVFPESMTDVDNSSIEIAMRAGIDGNPTLLNGAHNSMICFQPVLANYRSRTFISGNRGKGICFAVQLTGSNWEGNLLANINMGFVTRTAIENIDIWATINDSILGNDLFYGTGTQKGRYVRFDGTGGVATTTGGGMSVSPGGKAIVRSGTTAANCLQNDVLVLSMGADGAMYLHWYRGTTVLSSLTVPLIENGETISFLSSILYPIISLKDKGVPNKIKILSERDATDIIGSFSGGDGTGVTWIYY